MGGQAGGQIRCVWARAERTYGVCRTRADASHDGDQDVFLDRERARVDRDTEDLDAGHDACPETENREGDELGHDTGDGDGGVSEEEELVQTGDEDGPGNANEPGPEGAAGHVRVVGVGDGGTDLGVRGVILCGGG